MNESLALSLPYRDLRNEFLAPVLIESGHRISTNKLLALVFLEGLLDQESGKFLISINELLALLARANAGMPSWQVCR
jgi:hypothetical protein